MDLLKDIGSKDIDILLKDIELIQSGYNVYYIVDASDIISYSFPYGIYFNLINKVDIDDLGDSLIAYEYIFSKTNKPILLDEYKLELLLSRNLIKSNTDTRIQKNFFDLAYENTEDINSFKKKVESSTTFLLATALMQEKQIQKFDDIYFNKLQIDNIDLSNSNKNDRKILDTIFKTQKRPEWVSNIFKKWVESKSDIDYNDAEIIREYKSSLRDFIAIDRLCNINNLINENNDLENKYIFLYFSGAKKSTEFFQMEEVINHLPTINNIEKYNILRTPKDSFLLFLTFNEDLEIMRNSLLEFKSIAIRKEHLNNSFNSLKSMTSDLFKDQMKEIEIYFNKLNIQRRTLIEKSFIEVQINQHKDFKEQINKKIKTLESKSSYTEISEYYKELLNDAREANGKTELLQTSSSYLLQGSIIELLKMLTNRQEFKINKGKDLIKGDYHHLPILIFYDCNSITQNAKLEKLYIKLVDFVIGTSIFREAQLNNLIQEIKLIYSEIENEGSNKEYFYEILIKVFLLLFIEKADDIKIEVAEIIEDGFINLEMNQQAYKKWADDYLYTLIWVFRRIEEFDKSLQYCDQGIAKFPNDPRFYHGKVLVLYNYSFTKNSLNSCTLIQLDEIITHSEIAIEKYNQVLLQKDICRSDYKKYINGSISALNNLILYAISLYYLDNLESNQKSISQFKDYNLDFLRVNILSQIKKFEKNIGNSEKSRAEYCHTESIFELVESIYYKNKIKIGHAKSAINEALKINPDSELYKKTSLKIENWSNKI